MITRAKNIVTRIHKAARARTASSQTQGHRAFAQRGPVTPPEKKEMGAAVRFSTLVGVSSAPLAPSSHCCSSGGGKKQSCSARPPRQQQQRARLRLGVRA